VPKKTKVAIIGAGMIGNTHADAYNDTGEAEIVAICDVNEAALSKLADRVGVPAGGRYKDYRQMLTDADIQAVSVCVGTAWHKEVAVAALAAGKHVMLEKPMAINVGQAEEICQAASKAKGVLQLGMVVRYGPEMLALREWIDGGQMGDVYHMRAVTLRRRGVPGLGGWFTTKKYCGGGAVIDIGVHVIDLAMYLGGHWNPTSVSAMTYAKFGPQMKDYKYVEMWAGPPKPDGVFDVEDYATGMIRFADKATLTFEICWAANLKDELFVEILGEQAGAKVLNLDERPLEILTQVNGQLVDICPKYDPTQNRWKIQMQTFLAACRGESKPPATADQGRILMKTFDAIYASSASGKEVQIK
jgi:predicted dehydrogenase